MDNLAYDYQKLAEELIKQKANEILKCKKDCEDKFHNLMDLAQFEEDIKRVQLQKIWNDLEDSMFSDSDLAEVLEVWEIDDILEEIEYEEREKRKREELAQDEIKECGCGYYCDDCLGISWKDFM